MNSSVPNSNSRGGDSISSPRKAQYQFKVNGKLLKKKEKLGPEANSIQLTKRTNGPLQKDVSAGSFVDNNFRSNNYRSPGPISDDHHMSYTGLKIDPQYNVPGPLCTGGTFHRISPRGSPPRITEEEHHQDTKVGTRSACEEIKLDYIIASNSGIASPVPSAVVHNREN